MLRPQLMLLRHGLVHGHGISAQPVETPARPGLRSWISTRAREPMTWRELAYALVSIALWALDAVVVVLGPAGGDHRRGLVRP